jgi:hypothetical protein
MVGESPQWLVKDGLAAAVDCVAERTGKNRIDYQATVRRHDGSPVIINAVAPPLIFTVRTPELVPINPVISLLPAEDTLSNREIVTGRLKVYLRAVAAPGAR